MNVRLLQNKAYKNIDDNMQFLRIKGEIISWKSFKEKYVLGVLTVYKIISAVRKWLCPIFYS